MHYDTDQLEALLSVVDEGTFEGAARRLVLTQSAVSQRIKALEARVGRVLVIRSTPCRPTADGEHLVRLARQVWLLGAETTDQLGVDGASSAISVPVAMNADSLATWCVEVLRAAAAWDDVLLHVHVEDQEHSARLLRSGAVMGAITSDPTAVQGCSTESLGSMRYFPVATPDLLARHRSTRRVRWRELPVVRFNERDDLQERVLQEHGLAGHQEAPTHRVPSTEGFAVAVRLGLGWGALPEQQLDGGLEDGALVRLPGTRPIEVPLHWQRWRLSSPTLDAVTAAVVSAAGTLVTSAQGSRPGVAPSRLGST